MGPNIVRFDKHIASQKVPNHYLLPSLLVVVPPVNVLFYVRESYLLILSKLISCASYFLFPLFPCNASYPDT